MPIFYQIVLLSASFSKHAAEYRQRDLKCGVGGPGVRYLSGPGGVHLESRS